MSIKINAQWCIDHKACYSHERLEQLLDHDMALTEIRDRTDGPWAEVLIKHRGWVANRLIMEQPRPIWLEYLARIVERALARIKTPDPRSIAVVAALREDRVTKKICRAAREADSMASSAAWWAALDASWSVDSAEEVLAWAWSSSAASEYLAQINDVIELMGE